MSQCNSCGTINRDERRFCNQCGTSLGRVCECCAFFNFRDELFCGGCGLPLKSTAETSARAPVKTAVPAAVTRPSDRTVLISKEIKNVLQEISSKKDVVDGTKAVSQSEIDQLFKK